VSDGETWQEHLAAHFGEPIRNFGIGGYGVWQAYLRLQRHERTAAGANYVILNIFDDDHFRSIDAWRWLRIPQFRQEMRERAPWFFHANPWSHLRLGPDGRFVELPNAYPDREALYRLCDAEHVRDVFSKDIVANLESAKQGSEYDVRVIREAAEALGIQFDDRNADAAAGSACRIHTAFALKSSEYIVEKLVSWAKREGRKVMLMLSYRSSNTAAACEVRERFDARFVEWLRDHEIPIVDAWAAHAADYRAFRLPVADYMQRYFSKGFGHYSPAGNHFFAFAAKDALVSWLEPKPVTYRGEGLGASDVAGLLA
jgi:hypothetical protein